MGQLFDAGRDVVMDSGLPGTLWQGLSSTTPNAGGTNVTEPTGNGYARISLTMGASSGGIRQNTNAVQHAAVGGDWGTMTHSVYYTASSGGTAIGFDDLDAPRNMVDGATMDFGIGSVDFAQS